MQAIPKQAPAPSIFPGHPESPPGSIDLFPVHDPGNSSFLPFSRYFKIDYLFIFQN